MVSLQTWIQKIFGWGTFVGCVLFFPFAVIISLVTSLIRSIPTKYRVVKDKIVIDTGACSGIRQVCAQGNIPRWWPMMESADCAKKIVEAAMANRRWAVISFGYAFNIYFRLFAPGTLKISPRMFLLGKPPSKGLKTMSDSLIGEVTSRTLFQSLTAFAA